MEEMKRRYKRQKVEELLGMVVFGVVCAGLAFMMLDTWATSSCLLP